jgi:hypothetical protein
MLETAIHQVVNKIRRGGGHVAGLTVLLSLIALLALSAPAGATSQSRSLQGTVSSSGPNTAGGVEKRCKKRAKKCSKRKRGQGALRPKKRVKAVAPADRRVVGLPASVDLTAYRVPTGDQGQIGSCTAWAIDYAMLGWYSRHDGKPGQPFHPMYTYSQVKLPGPRGGSTPEAALRVAKTQGNDTIAHYQHPLDDDDTQPNASERGNAANYKVADWKTVFTQPGNAGGGSAGVTLIETELAAGHPVAITMRVRPGFKVMYNRTSVAAATDNDVSGAEGGYHEVLALGYDQVGLVIQNSWGDQWGYHGLGRLSWRVVQKDVVAAHVITGFVTSGNNEGPPPTMGSVVQEFALDQSTSSTTAPVRVSWSASSARGIAAYEVYVKTDNGEYYRQNVPPNATQYTWSLAAGHTYSVAVKARDGAGTWSGYSYSQPITPSFTDDTAFGNVGSPWGRYNLDGTFGGTYIAAAAAGAWVQLPFTGTDIALIPVMFSTAGRSTVYCDGVASTTRDFYSGTTVLGRVGATCHFAQSGQHSMKIVAEGTSGRPWLGVDAFAVF